MRRGNSICYSLSEDFFKNNFLGLSKFFIFLFVYVYMKFESFTFSYYMETTFCCDLLKIIVDFSSYIFKKVVFMLILTEMESLIMFRCTWFIYLLMFTWLWVDILDSSITAIFTIQFQIILDFCYSC